MATSTPKKPAEDAPATPRPNPAASGDPAVHQLLALRQTHQMNADADALAAVDAQLADLGY